MAQVLFDGYRVPSTFVIRDCLMRIEAGALDRALAAWNQTWGDTGQAISIDGKTMKNAIDEDGNQTHILSAIGHETATCYAQKKVDSLPIVGSDEVKRTNEIGMAIPLLANCALAGKDVTADALLTQRSIATYIVEQKGHYHFTVKGNQPTLEEDIALIFAQRGAADFVEITPPDHGRIETRRIWGTTALNDYLDFPHVGQVFMIEREAFNKKSGKSSHEIALGVTSRPPNEASPQRLLAKHDPTIQAQCLTNLGEYRCTGRHAFSERPCILS